MIRHLLGRIAALCRRAALPGSGRHSLAAKEDEAMNVDGPAGATMLTAGETPAARPSFAASEDLLARAMVCLGIDCERFSEREANWLRDMRLTCLACDARSRCRRDVSTGDFARRYRHYCRNADSLSRIAAGKAQTNGSPRKTPQA